MSVDDIVLVIISGLGVVHGLFLAIFLWTYRKGNRLSNILLGLLLLVLSFRVGKSVFLEFTPDLDVKFIFAGLGTIMAIGPLFYLFAKSCINKSFVVSRKYLLQFIPSILGVCFGLWLEDHHMESIPLVFFAALFFSYYLHFIIYIFITYKLVKEHKAKGLNIEVYELLMLFVYGLSAIWVVYVLNLFDETVPYIVGPVLYSVVAYVISFIVISKDYISKIDQTKYKTTTISDEQSRQLYSRVLELVENEKQYQNPELTLKSMSKDLNVTTQTLSMVINQRSGKNFNSFINYYRIEESKQLLHSKAFKNHTMAAIAFEVGFNSISSFNTAFKKQTGKTPVAFKDS
ncbi:helix-turn-helix domain-containing protein [Fulvivirga sp.]|uniref:helix-turn-helix domain-containing protein n=1 Tax=Fulvivirga sp. TaxID=1931237 RepID=UPI0032EFC66B